MARWLLYGANGYTGVLIAEEAKRRGLESRVFPLDDAAALDRAVAEVDAPQVAPSPRSRRGRRDSSATENTENTENAENEDAEREAERVGARALPALRPFSLCDLCVLCGRFLCDLSPSLRPLRPHT